MLCLACERSMMITNSNKFFDFIWMSLKEMRFSLYSFGFSNRFRFYSYESVAFIYTFANSLFEVNNNNLQWHSKEHYSGLVRDSAPLLLFYIFQLQFVCAELNSYTFEFIYDAQLSHSRGRERSVKLVNWNVRSIFALFFVSFRFVCDLRWVLWNYEYLSWINALCFIWRMKIMEFI